MFCPKCGKDLPDNSKFCKYCGSQIKNKGTLSMFLHLQEMTKKAKI